MFLQREFFPAYYLSGALIVALILSFLFAPLGVSLVAVCVCIGCCGFLFASALRVVRTRIEYVDFSKQAQAIINNMPIGVVVYDANFEVKIFNPAAEDIFGITAQEAQQQRLEASLAMDPKLQVFVQVIFSTLAPIVIKRSDPGKYPQVADIIFDDPHIELNVVTDIVRDASGKANGFIKLITNKTREANLIKSKAEFIMVAAHQLRTPLTAVHWAMEALEQSVTDPSQKELLDTGFGAVKNSLKIVNDLLDVAKIEEGRFGYEFHKINILDFLQRAFEQVHDLAKQYGIKFYFEHTPQANTEVSIDEQKLGIVFFNLFDNAIQYNVEHGEVFVKVQRDMAKNTVVISVRDTGIGIPPQELKKVFSKFFRADNAQKTVANGNGLGLYIARNITQAHGGDMWVESELNRGTTFFVSIPVERQQVSEALVGA